jgi:uncharacterized membrane protein (DUF485 family)
MHEANAKTGTDKASKYKEKLGLILFLIYMAVYAAFITVNVAVPRIMGILGPFGVNLAIWYGMGLIVLALVLGIIYNAFCTRAEKSMNERAKA